MPAVQDPEAVRASAHHQHEGEQVTEIEAQEALHRAIREAGDAGASLYIAAREFVAQYEADRASGETEAAYAGLRSALDWHANQAGRAHALGVSPNNPLI
jgi:hypothetical protein